MQFWTESGDTRPTEKDIEMGLVNIEIQDFSKRIWELRVVKNRDRTEEMQRRISFPASSPSATRITWLELMCLGMGSTGKVTVVQSAPIVHQKTGEFEKMHNFIKILISVRYAASRK